MSDVRERNVLNVSPEEEPTRRREDFALQEAFGEVKLFDVGSNFDFVSVRAGIQPFTSDFRGFLFRDNNLGVRVFGTWGRNRNQWNVAYFDQLEKETNSGLNLFERRKQQVIIANYFRQDFLTPGYTISPSVHVNIDKGEELFFDANGFLVRPSPIGLITPHQVKAYYAGFAGDGHWGRLNVTHQFYQALGEDDFNGISGQKTDINAQFAAAEAVVRQGLAAAARELRVVIRRRRSRRRRGAWVRRDSRQSEHRAAVRSASGTGKAFGWPRPAWRSSAATASFRRSGAARPKGRRAS